MLCGQEHPGISKNDRKRISRLMDCKKLSMEACVHACQNDRLPLRVVVQVSAFTFTKSALTVTGTAMIGIQAVVLGGPYSLTILTAIVQLLNNNFQAI